MTSLKTLSDVNVWLALAFGQHPQHASANVWFGMQQNASAGFCRLTQMNLLRLLTQRVVMGTAVLTQHEAWHVYDRLQQDERVLYSNEPISLDEIFRRTSDREEISAKRWADDYLLAFAEAAGLTLVTFDGALAARVPSSILLRP
jgi:uncharacterized protein